MTRSAASYQDRERKHRLQRWVDVHPGEGAALCWSVAYFFCLLFAYYLLRPLRDAFGVEHGFEKLPWLMTGTLSVALLSSPLYAWLVSRVPRRRFLPITYRFFLANVLVFYALLRSFASGPGPCPMWLSYSFFIWLTVFIVFVVSVFWSFLADIFSSGQAKRLFGVVSLGGTFGAIGGAFVAERFVEKIGGPGLLLLAAVSLEASAQCVRRLLRLTDPARPAIAPSNVIVRAHAEEPGRRILAGLELALASTYLRRILIYVFAFGLMSTFIYMEQNRIVETSFQHRDGRTAAFARLDLWYNVFTLGAQTFLAGRILRWIGLGPALTIVPAVSLLGFLGLWFGLDRFPSAAYMMILVFQVVRRSLHFAIDRPAREVLFTVVGADAKYKSKNLIDTFVFRTGDMLGGWVVTGLSAAGIALGFVAVPLALAGIALGAVLGTMQARLGARVEQSSSPERGRSAASTAT